MNIYAPSKLDLLRESSEDNCAEHYAFRRDWDNAYWTAILFAYRLAKKGNTNPGLVAYQMFSDEVMYLNSCH